MVDDDSFPYDSDLDKLSPFPNECPNEIYGIESLYTCFMHRYNACPALFMGSLQDACQAAFSSNVIKERRPLLVYIHDDKSPFSNIFCWNVFCTDTIVNYLLDNYIVWVWDITFESNRNTLTKVWNEIFPTQKSMDFSVKQCPMLIGIMRPFVREKDWSYEITSLLEGDTLTFTKEKFSPKLVLDELTLFKEECDDNEQAFLFRLMNRTGFNQEVILEICKYLSLNDAIDAFSTNILSFLRQSKSKVHISKPCPTSIKAIVRKLEPEQIVSLCLNTDEYWLKMVFLYLPMFQNVVSLTTFNLQLLEQVDEYKIHFPKLTRLSLWYDNEIGFSMMKSIFYYLSHSIRRFEIHCPGALCTHYDREAPNGGYDSIKYFVLDMGHNPLNSTNECCQHYKSCFLMTTIDLMQVMIGIRYFRLITSKYNLENLLDINDWNCLLKTCSLLKRVTLQVIEDMLEDKELQQKVLKFQNEWHSIRPWIRFRVVSI